MSIERYFTIRCDGCGRTDGPNDMAEIKIRESLAILRSQGWHHWNGARTWCPDCIPKAPPDPRQTDLFAEPTPSRAEELRDAARIIRS